MTTNLSFLPTNENNLVYKAAKLLMDEFQIRDGIDVKLHKYIPVAAGMAGGSTDAAAVLYGMNRMFELGLSKEELMQRGLRSVQMFLTALCVEPHLQKELVSSLPHFHRW